MISAPAPGRRSGCGLPGRGRLCQGAAADDRRQRPRFMPLPRCPCGACGPARGRQAGLGYVGRVQGGRRRDARARAPGVCRSRRRRGGEVPAGRRRDSGNTCVGAATRGSASGRPSSTRDALEARPRSLCGGASRQSIQRGDSWYESPMIRRVADREFPGQPDDSASPVSSARNRRRRAVGRCIADRAGGEGVPGRCRVRA